MLVLLPLQQHYLPYLKYQKNPKQLVVSGLVHIAVDMQLVLVALQRSVKELMLMRVDHMFLVALNHMEEGH